MIGGTNCGAGGEPAPKSNVIVTTTESELVGKNVTFEQGTKTLTKAFTDSKQVVFTTKEMGIVSITCEEISKSVNVATLGVDYNVSLKRTRVVITTESDDLVGQTVTLKKNDTTIESKAFTSTKSLTFIISSIGIYTAYCGDYEVDVNVTALGGTYSGDIVPITEVTVTVNGGALETITITDSDGTSQTVTTNSSGTTVATLNTSNTYTFSGGVSGYSVQKTIASDTSKVDVMPDNVVYWYGNKVISATYISNNTDGVGGVAGMRIDTPIDLTSFTKLVWKAKKGEHTSTWANNNIYYRTSIQSNISSSFTEQNSMSVLRNNATYKRIEFDISSVSGLKYFVYGIVSGAGYTRTHTNNTNSVYDYFELAKEPNQYTQDQYIEAVWLE